MFTKKVNLSCWIYTDESAVKMTSLSWFATVFNHVCIFLPTWLGSALSAKIDCDSSCPSVCVTLSHTRRDRMTSGLPMWTRYGSACAHLALSMKNFYMRLTIYLADIIFNCIFNIGPQFLKAAIQKALCVVTNILLHFQLIDYVLMCHRKHSLGCQVGIDWPVWLFNLWERHTWVCGPESIDYSFPPLI